MSGAKISVFFRKKKKIQRFKDSKIRFTQMKGISTQGRLHLSPGPSPQERGAGVSGTREWRIENEMPRPVILNSPFIPSGMAVR
jgi:hypothetical protein